MSKKVIKEKGCTGKFRNFWLFLWKPEVPLILMIIFTVIVYLVCPKINQTFEEQKIRNQYIIDNLNNLKNDTQEMFKFIMACNASETARKNNLANVKNIEMKLQYRAIELEIIFGKNKNIDEFKNSLYRLKKLYGIDIKKLKYTERERIGILRACYLENFVDKSRNMTYLLARKANLIIQDNYKPSISKECEEFIRNNRFN